MRERGERGRGSQFGRRDRHSGSRKDVMINKKNLNEYCTIDGYGKISSQERGQESVRDNERKYEKEQRKMRELVQKGMSCEIIK